MKRLLIIAALLIVGATASYGQQECSGVCVTKEAAIKALQDDDRVKAQAQEIIAKDQAIDDLKKEVARMQLEVAKLTGELTGSQQMVVRLSAVLDLALKNTRKRCAPFSICF